MYTLKCMKRYDLAGRMEGYIALLSVILFLGQGILTTRADDFPQKAEKAMQNVAKAFGIQNCIDRAKADAQKKGYTQKDMYFYAAAWIGMYCHQCDIPKEYLPQDKTLTNFPFRLNKELRCSFENARDPGVKARFQEAGHILDEALGILGEPHLYQKLFRGYTVFPYTGANYFIDEGYFSTSKDINVGLKFADGNTLMIITDMTGSYISPFAEKKFEYQKEVLASTGSQFQINQKVTNKQDIINILKPYKPMTKLPQPKEILLVTQVSLSTEDFTKVRDAQHKMDVGYCKPSKADSMLFHPRSLVSFDWKLHMMTSGKSTGSKKYTSFP